ncbi:GTPase [Caminibacter pacificus]
MCNLKYLEKVLEEKQNSKPWIMVYGIYNSGKSTLINALLGEEKATIGDVPTTDRIDEYKFNGFRLYDTPGIEAPIQHEKITKEFLRKNDVVVFVLSSDSSFEEVKVYEEMKKILEMDKKLILVLNNKTKAQNIGEILEKIENNLMRFGIDVEKIRVVSVNAKSALKAKKEQKSTLLKRSNILLLEKLLLDVVNKSDIKNTIEFLIKDTINKEISFLTEKIDNVTLKEKREILNEIEHQEYLLKYELIQYLEKETLQIKNDIESLLFNNQEIDSYLDKKIEEIKGCLIEKINSSIDVTYQSLSLKQEQKSFDIPLDVLKNRELVEPILKDVLLKLRELKVPFIKGKWEKTLSGWAGKIAWGISVAVSIYEVYSVYKKDAEYKEAQIKRTLEIEKISNEIAFDLFEQFKANIDSSVESLYKNIKNSLLEEIRNLENNNSDIISQIECLKDLEEKLIEKYLKSKL